MKPDPWSMTNEELKAEAGKGSLLLPEPASRLAAVEKEIKRREEAAIPPRRAVQ